KIGDSLTSLRLRLRRKSCECSCAKNLMDNRPSFPIWVQIQRTGFSELPAHYSAQSAARRMIKRAKRYLGLELFGSMNFFEQKNSLRRDSVDCLQLPENGAPPMAGCWN